MSAARRAAMREIRIGTRAVGEGHPAFVAAEIGFNHGGDVDLALKMIDAAADAGADAVKFQTYRAADLALESSPHFQLIRSGELSEEVHRRLADAARARGVAFFSTPYSPAAADLLERVGVPAYKIASMDLTNPALLRHVAAKGRPVVLSTGMAVEEEIAEALAVLRSAGNEQTILLHCVSNYPTDPAQANVRTVPRLREAFGVPVGFSDHTLDPSAAVAAVALGACFVEKHFTTDRALPGPDHSLSADPAGMRDLVSRLRAAERALGRPVASTERPDRANAPLYRRGLFAATDIAAGQRLTADLLRAIRPESGLPARFLDRLVGRPAPHALRRDQPIPRDWA